MRPDSAPDAAGSKKTRRNRYYKCSDNKNIEDKDKHISSTDWIGAKIAQEWGAFECLWARAIVPRSLLPVKIGANDAVFQEPPKWQIGNFGEALAKTDGMFGTDGSGGPTAPQHLKGCSSGRGCVRL